MNLPKISKNDRKLRGSLENAFPNKEKIYGIIVKENNIELSDIMIDYYFNDISYNVYLDIKELLNFQLSNGITIPIEHIKMYKDILNLDNLSSLERIKLNDKLKKENILEMFYDDYTNSRDRMYQEISDSVLNKEKIEQFKDK
jgi:hypothetical protein